MKSLEDVEGIREKTQFDRKARGFTGMGEVGRLASFTGMPETDILGIIERTRAGEISDLIHLLGAMEVLADRHALDRIRDVRAYVQSLLTSDLSAIDEAGGHLDEKDLEQIELLRRSIVGVLDRRVSLLSGAPGAD